jgi:hypothetical protein
VGRQGDLVGCRAWIVPVPRYGCSSTPPMAPLLSIACHRRGCQRGCQRTFATTDHGRPSIDIHVPIEQCTRNVVGRLGFEPRRSPCPRRSGADDRRGPRDRPRCRVSDPAPRPRDRRGTRAPWCRPDGLLTNRHQPLREGSTLSARPGEGRYERGARVATDDRRDMDRGVAARCAKPSREVGLDQPMSCPERDSADRGQSGLPIIVVHCPGLATGADPARTAMSPHGP